MSDFIGIEIPYAGRFNQDVPELQVENDYIFLDESRVVYYAQQTNQGIGYIGIANFTSFTGVMDPASTIEKQQILHVGEITGVKLFKIAENRILVLVDRKVYILDFVGFEYTVVAEKDDVFIGGARVRGNTISSSTTTLNWVGNSIKENELLFIDCEVVNPLASNGAVFKLYRLVYNPSTNTISNRILKKDLSLDFNMNASSEAVRYNGRIEAIPGTSSYYIWFARAGTSTSNMPYMTYSAIIDDEGNELSQIPFPVYIPTFNSTVTDSGTWTTHAVALREDLIVYFSGAGRYVIYFNGTLTTAIQNTSLFGYTSNSSIYDVKALDENHFIMSWNGFSSTMFTGVFRVDSTNLITGLGQYNTDNLLLTSGGAGTTRDNALEYYGGNTWLLRYPKTTILLTNPELGSQRYVRFAYFRLDL